MKYFPQGHLVERELPDGSKVKEDVRQKSYKQMNDNHLRLFEPALAQYLFDLKRAGTNILACHCLVRLECVLQLKL